MAVKEEKYDPGYEAAYGGAYCDRAPYESEQCNFSSNGTGKGWCSGHSFSKPFCITSYNHSIHLSFYPLSNLHNSYIHIFIHIYIYVYNIFKV